MKQKSSQFDKFAKKKSNAAIKEQFKQEKRKVKKEREDFFDKKKQAPVHSRQSPGGNRQSGGSTRQSGVGSQQSGASSRQSGAGNQQAGGRFEKNETSTHKPQSGYEKMPLNKFIAHAGICSRRDAAEMVKIGKVKVNDEVVTEPGLKVTEGDEIKVNGKVVQIAKELIYILLNKPKDYITTTDDPQKRKTVVDLIRRTIRERVFPVGRLDRNTSGVLLLTNDGELAQKLTHPSHEVKKVYAVTLDKPLDKKDFEQILKGVTLNDGPASVDVLAYADPKDKTQLGVEIHSGRNRIVRRIFEHLGYDVKGLDRVFFAGLTKKNIERGKWRFLSEKEVRELKYFGKGK